MTLAKSMGQVAHVNGEIAAESDDDGDEDDLKQAEAPPENIQTPKNDYDDATDVHRGHTSDDPILRREEDNNKAKKHAEERVLDGVIDKQ